ncbi:hypothetical protein COL26_21980 [Bacillus thuringiensis]|uniref:Uncharacterized protein n=1 Tax=Bacillus thuringiensis TaxID=1428 RepID=A0ABD6S2X9_BACTU|nr:hypothetical protein [Bacillus thuringiensis]PER40830.1 hypothetical protein CN495_33370 [Bacillus thuringiensis]PEU85299.1 hypothetical protein CN411_21010 [Bacillus thuringiensis]PFI05790.1 hypothetical protein COI79_24435 [Bacillus thuringiensis]PFW34635.1 hypothetical protein COL26_21980 [Bacillus thuringiensis]PGY81671.1 hypothetical protein COE44_06305 [Bacillus thuringiensis]
MAESAFEGTVLEGRERRYTVLNEKDLERYVNEEKREEFRQILNEALGEIEDGRLCDDKKAYNSYIVINTDESYINEIIEVMKRHGHFK